MDTSKVDIFYGKIANTVNRMIPDEWFKVLLYAEIDDDGGSVIFYYYTFKESQAFYSLDIEKMPNIDLKNFKTLYYELYDYLEDLRLAIIELGQEPWTSLTMELYNTGKFEFRFDYTHFNEDKANSFERKMIWKYKNLGMKPTKPADIKFLEKYLKEEKQ